MCASEDWLRGSLRRQGKSISYWGAYEDTESDRKMTNMAKVKVEIVRPDCSGCELCTQTCPDYFEMAADGLSVLKGGKRVGDNDELELDDEACTRDAAADCPVNCIHLYENGNKVL